MWQSFLTLYDSWETKRASQQALKSLEYVPPEDQFHIFWNYLEKEVKLVLLRFFSRVVHFKIIDLPDFRKSQVHLQSCSSP